MSDKTTEEMEAELVDAGYDVIIDDNGDLEIEYIVDGISVDWTLDRDVGNDAMMRHVFSYLQDKRKLEAIEGFLLESLFGDDYIWNPDLAHEMKELVKQFDITAPESKSE